MKHEQSFSFWTRKSNLCPLQWKRRVLTSGLPGNSVNRQIIIFFFFFLRNKEKSESKRMPNQPFSFFFFREKSLVGIQRQMPQTCSLTTAEKDLSQQGHRCRDETHRAVWLSVVSKQVPLSGQNPGHSRRPGRDPSRVLHLLPSMGAPRQSILALASGGHSVTLQNQAAEHSFTQKC